MNEFKEITKLLFKFEEFGVEQTQNDTILIGKAPHLGPEAWLNTIYEPLSEFEIKHLEIVLNTEIPIQYKYFLRNFSNGLNVLCSTFSLYGLRKINGRDLNSSRQPYSIETPNIWERPNNSNESYFYIGGYNWDGSNLYINKENNKVYCCERYDSSPKFEWNSLNEMIYSEIIRIYNLFDTKGIELNEDISTLPY